MSSGGNCTISGARNFLENLCLFCVLATFCLMRAVILICIFSQAAQTNVWVFLLLFDFLVTEVLVFQPICIGIFFSINADTFTVFVLLVTFVESKFWHFVCPSASFVSLAIFIVLYSSVANNEFLANVLWHFAGVAVASEMCYLRFFLDLGEKFHVLIFLSLSQLHASCVCSVFVHFYVCCALNVCSSAER